jgi:hypothetical protein
VSGLLWFVAVVTALANLPSIVWYGLPAARAAGNDRERWGAAMYVVTRAFALMAVPLIGASLIQYGVVLGAAAVVILVQALDIAVAARRRKPREAIGAGVLATLVLCSVVTYAVLTR